MPTDHFAGDVARRYDEEHAEASAPAVVDPAVAFLADAAGGPGGRALELAIGTGRLALPLAARGVEVSGIELSADMVAELRRRPGGDALPVTIGDMSHADAPGGAGAFDLVYLAFNTIMNLTTQDAQVACFANAARHLRPGGRFVVEVMVPDLRRLPPGERFHPFAVADDRLGVDEYDVVGQRMWSHHHRLVGDHWVRRTVPFRYVWPSELDLMARLAGLDLRERWAGWGRTPFDAESRSHVTAWSRHAP